jgi:ABC-type multidrug transport system permease subunit
MATSGKAPRFITWLVCFILYVSALASYFGFIRLSGEVTAWLWIIGFGLLLLAVRIRGL